jgi:hypothetical protein
VLQFAKTADPDGVRTVGVLTKADLVKEQAVVQTSCSWSRATP